MEETYKGNARQPEVPLVLEMLRQKQIEVFPKSWEEKKRKMELIIEHRLKFPSKLRHAIWLQRNETPGGFLYSVYGAVRDFLLTRAVQIQPAITQDPKLDVFLWNFGRHFRGANQGEEIAEWHGLDKNIDTEEEAEIAIRFFPEVLDEHLWNEWKKNELIEILGQDFIIDLPTSVDVMPPPWMILRFRDIARGEEMEKVLGVDGMEELAVRVFPEILNERDEQEVEIPRPQYCFMPNVHPTNLLISSAKAISFVPLFLKLGLEIGSHRHYFDSWHMYSSKGRQYRLETIKDLLVNRSLITLSDEESSMGLDDQSLEILLILMESGLVETKEFDDNFILSWFLRRAKTLDSEYVERRLRFMIEWNPELFLNFDWEVKTSLLCEFGSIYRSPPSDSLDKLFSMLGLIIELGTTHYPADLGFVFHKSNYQNFCDDYGGERIAELVHDKLLGTLRQNNQSLQKAMIVAATQCDFDQASPDGLYTLIRCDPVETLMLEDTQLRREVARWLYFSFDSDSDADAADRGGDDDGGGEDIDDHDFDNIDGR